MAGVRRAASGPVVSQALARGVMVSWPGRPLGRRRPCRGAPRTCTGSKKMYAPLTTPSLAVSRSNKASESGTPGRRTPPGRTRRLPPPPVVLSSAVQEGGGGTETRWNGRTGAREQERTLSRAASLPNPGHARCCSHHLADASFGAPVEFDAHALAEGPHTGVVRHSGTPRQRHGRRTRPVRQRAPAPAGRGGAARQGGAARHTQGACPRPPRGDAASPAASPEGRAPARATPARLPWCCRPWRALPCAPATQPGPPKARTGRCGATEPHVRSGLARHAHGRHTALTPLLPYHPMTDCLSAHTTEGGQGAAVRVAWVQAVAGGGPRRRPVHRALPARLSVTSSPCGRRRHGAEQQRGQRGRV